MSVSFFIILIIIIVLSSIGIITISKYNEITKNSVKISDAEEKVEKALATKLELILGSIEIIDKNKKTNNKTLNKVKKLKLEEISSFEADELLTNASKEISKVSSNIDKVLKSKKFKEIKIELKDNEEKLIALRTFYNKYVTNYNELIDSFFGAIISKIFKFDKKDLFEGKNLTIENVVDFKI